MFRKYQGSRRKSIWASYSNRWQMKGMIALKNTHTHGWGGNQFYIFDAAHLLGLVRQENDFSER